MVQRFPLPLLKRRDIGRRVLAGLDQACVAREGPQSQLARLLDVGRDRREDVVELELQALEQWRAKGVPATEGAGEFALAVLLPMNRDGLGHRVDHPVLEHAVSAVEVVLVPQVPVGGGRGEYLDHEVGGSPHVLVGERVLARSGDEQQVGLRDVGVRQNGEVAWHQLQVSSLGESSSFSSAPRVRG